jgi:hypothetical protein
MAAQYIDATPFLPALRKVIRSLPFNDDDRSVLLAAVEQCALHSHNAKEAAAARRRHAVKPRQRPPLTPEQRLRQKLYKREWRARRARSE